MFVRTVFFIMGVLISPFLHAQDEQMIIRIPKQTEWNVFRIGQQLRCLDGVHFSGYAKDASCLLLRYNTEYIKDPEIITTMIHHLNRKLKFEVIRGVTAYEIIDGKIPPVTEPKKVIKKGQ